MITIIRGAISLCELNTVSGKEQPQRKRAIEAIASITLVSIMMCISGDIPN